MLSEKYGIISYICIKYGEMKALYEFLRKIF